MTGLFADLLAAFRLLTRLPVGRRAAHPADPRRALWAYPVVGGVVGALGGAVFWLGSAIGLVPVLAGLWTIAGLAALTGGLHEDGLADTADGFGGGRTPERKLAIMRDSAVGAFGVLALVLTIGARAAAIAAIAEPAQVMRALVAAGALGRAALLLPLLLTRPARADGLAAALAPPLLGRMAAGWLLAIGVTLALVPPRPGAWAIALAVATGVACARLAARQIGGFTGDVLGATEMAAECAVLSILSATG